MVKNPEMCIVMKRCSVIFILKISLGRFSKLIFHLTDSMHIVVDRHTIHGKRNVVRQTKSSIVYGCSVEG